MSSLKRSVSEPSSSSGNAASGSSGSSVPAAKKPRKKSVTAKSLGLSQADFTRVKAPATRKTLTAIVKTLAVQVDEDWHDGYEEQAETVGEWFDALQAPLQAVLDIGVAQGAALLQCNEMLKVVADSWLDLNACPCRCDIREGLGDSGDQFTLTLPWADGKTLTMTGGGPAGDVESMWGYVWAALLRTHAAAAKGTDEALLLQCIKDASDNGAALAGPLGADENDEEDCEGAPTADALARIVAEKAWVPLPTTKKVHRMRCAIDRRFDGSPDRRTRDYHLNDSSDDDSCGDPCFW
jgi:hypothetical protein